MNELMGKKCKDRVTGFEGICVGYVEWMYGCKKYILQPVSEKTGERKDTASFFEKELEVIGDGLMDAEIPEYVEPALFGKECVDKVTKIKGVCSGRITMLFAGQQYCLEYKNEEKGKDPIASTWLDEGRLEPMEKKVVPAEVQGTRTGGPLDAGIYPDRNREMTAFLG